VMPVLETGVPPVAGGIGQNIVSLTYVWIDGPAAGDDGLTWASGSTLRSFEGYVVDPRYLPELVAGSPVIGPFLGGDMPKEALLMTDIGS